MRRLRGSEGPGSVMHLNCFDKALLSFEVNCTGRRIGYSGIFSVRGEPDPDRLRKAILSTARAHPEMMTTLYGGPFWHQRQLHEEVLGEVRFCSAKIGPAEFQQLRAKSKSVGGSVNDILMAACYRSIDKWNRRHGKRTRKISFLVPIDIGSPDLNGIISNQISYISFSTSAKDRTDSTRLLRRVSAKRIYMLKERRGNTYSIVYFASVLRRLPLAAMKVFSKYVLFPLYADTVICTNPGIVKVGDCGEGTVEPGGFRILDFTAVPFVFSVMGMNVCVATFNGSLGIDIAYATSHFSKEKAEEFLALCVDEIANYEVNAQQA
jgi:NRPS condensation-like uncharacterized protein